MLDEAQLNCQRRGVHNASFARSDDQLSQVRGPFNFVHSYIVFQHIPRLRGEVIFKRMLDLLEDGGVGAVHFTYGRQSSLLRRIALWSRTKVPFVNGVRNLLHRQPFNYPMMQLNEYELSRIFRLLQQHGCGQAYIQYSSHGVVDTNALGAMIFFQKRTFPGW
jgi:trans-aconitate methyltransferase